MYEIPFKTIHNAISELIKRVASVWYRSDKEYWRSWKEFKQDSFNLFFVPSRLRVELEDEVREYKQKANQGIYDYATVIQTFMRRFAGLPEIEQLNQIYANLICDYQLFTKRTYFEVVKKLKMFGEDYEFKANRTKSTHRHRPSYNAATITLEPIMSTADSIHQQQNPSRPKSSTSNEEANRQSFTCYTYR